MTLSPELSEADELAPKARHQKEGNPNRISLFLVPATGVEPVHPCGYGILSPGCLPVPPRRPAANDYSTSQLMRQSGPTRRPPLPRRTGGAS